MATVIAMIYSSRRCKRNTNYIHGIKWHWIINGGDKSNLTQRKNMNGQHVDIYYNIGIDLGKKHFFWTF